MTGKTDICKLDYLIGTFSTSYKGIITSLTMKDFNVSAEAGKATFRGTIMAMPQGNYDICLIHSGIEIDRTKLHRGFFILISESSIVEEAKNLQLDIVQAGRHVGTFLLKKGEEGGLYTSALELNQELSDINFGMLTDPLKNKMGIMENAESIISSILSTKKDWEKLSEKINTFAKDIFWFERDSYYPWYRILVSFSVKSYLGGDLNFRDKKLSNLLSLIELPLEREADEKRLAVLFDTWKGEILEAPIHLSYRYSHAIRIFSYLRNRLPGVDIRPVMKKLLHSLKTKETRFINRTLITSLGSFMADEDLKHISEYSEDKINVMKAEIENAEMLLNDGVDISDVINMISRFDIRILYETDMIDALFESLGRSISKIPAEEIIRIFSEIFDLMETISESAYRSSLSYTAKILKQLISLEKADHCKHLLKLIEESAPGIKDTLLNRDIAQATLESGDSDLAATYRGILRNIVIPAPSMSGFSAETWAEIYNPLHTRRLSGLLQILTFDSSSQKDILLHLVCNLYLIGLFIPDEKIFQREVSAFINSSSMRSNYLLNYMLLKRLPVFHSEVGATGRLRELTTEIDSWGNDMVIYFLRKQVHVNASNNNIELTESIIKAWSYNSPEMLKSAVPEEIIEKIDPDLLMQYSSAIRPLFESLKVMEGDTLSFKRLLGASYEEIERQLQDTGASDEIISKIKLLCKTYKEIIKKYTFKDTGHALHGDTLENLSGIIEKLKELKDIITSDRKTLPVESLYFKRHIAFGIPSVIGTFHEPKFDALAESLRIESRARVLFEEISSQIEVKLRDWSERNMKDWILSLVQVNELFKLHGIENVQVDEVLAVMDRNTLRFSQLIDLLRTWQRELTWIVEDLHRKIYPSLTRLIEIFSRDELPGHLKRYGEDKQFVSKTADITVRDMISSIVGLEELDRLLNSLIKALSLRVEAGTDNEFSLSESPRVIQGEYFDICELSFEDATGMAPIIGSKIKNLAVLHERGLNVPGGVVFSSRITHRYGEYVESDDFRLILKNAVKSIENRTGLVFGHDSKPLFLSVRSGSYISMPGILSSILYCGMNTDTVMALIEDTDDSWLAWDSYRRFIEHYSRITLNVEMGAFERISYEMMARSGASSLQELDSGEMEEVVSNYLKILSQNNLLIPHDAYEQLKESVKAVYRSWYGEKARQFRKAMNISEHWGTSVTLMQMIYGNRADSGASVFFTRKPLSLEKGIYGEIREKATCDDIVHGKFLSRPLSKDGIEDGNSLEEIDSELFSRHERVAERIEETMGGLPQEVEATYVKDGEIYVLQTRRMEFIRGLSKRFPETCRMYSGVIGRGVGVHGGALKGIVSFQKSPESIREMKKKFNKPIILLTKETSTDDVSLMPEIDGIITATGGVASHASILSQKFNITAVVSCSDMRIAVDEHGETHAFFGAYKLSDGMPVGIDGSYGLVYSGECMLTGSGGH
jgi:pyruvate,orthophosphate dikinase